jgi:hypothetical protein
MALRKRLNCCRPQCFKWCSPASLSYMVVMQRGKWRPATRLGSCPAVISPNDTARPDDSYRLLRRAWERVAVYGVEGRGG